MSSRIFEHLARYLRSQQELANKLGICTYQRIEHVLNILFPKIIRLAAHHQGWRQAVGVDGRVVTVKSTCGWDIRFFLISKINENH